MEKPHELLPELPLSEGIIERNLHLMRTEMKTLLDDESIGGNAQSLVINGRKCPCAAVNGVIDTTNGAMKAFSNHRFSRDFEEAGIVLRVAFDGDASKIADWTYASPLQEETMRMVQECIDRWNTERAILWGKVGE